MTYYQTRSKNKYSNVSKVYNGRTYDSKLEARVAESLDWRIKAGEVKEVIPQFKIDIRINGKHWRNYYCDFKVIRTDGFIEYIEAKGMELEVWKMKRDVLMLVWDEIMEPNSEYIVIK